MEHKIYQTDKLQESTQELWRRKGIRRKEEKEREEEEEEVWVTKSGPIDTLQVLVSVRKGKETSGGQEETWERKIDKKAIQKRERQEWQLQ